MRGIRRALLFHYCPGQRNNGQRLSTSEAQVPKYLVQLHKSLAQSIDLISVDFLQFCQSRINSYRHGEPQRTIRPGHNIVKDLGPRALLSAASVVERCIVGFRHWDRQIVSLRYCHKAESKREDLSTWLTKNTRSESKSTMYGFVDVEAAEMRSQ